ncbi:hypothetical protein FH972_026206 [Carpinus fangiana]|uniref:RecQ-mediated genome instability protein 1 n=1 Tax=Carpinus fangiana TaxID=176857 RepID=A0A5N6L3A4_9ROSI|nr:hypothetical protein FH972_026206 [Carpinus fangiana]
MVHPAHSQIRSHLASKHLVATEAWLTAVLTTQRPTTPLPALKSTILFRLLASDFTKSLSVTSTSCFPPDVLDTSRQERLIHGPIPVQILDIDDIGHSKWSQIETIEAVERGETTKGREVIRTVVEEDSTDATTLSSGPFKLLLQDAKGTRVYAIEISPLPGVGLGTSIGAKLILKDVKVSRGVILMDSGTVLSLAGKIATWDKQWRADRKERLLRTVDSER